MGLAFGKCITEMVCGLGQEVEFLLRNVSTCEPLGSCFCEPHGRHIT